MDKIGSKSQIDNKSQKNKIFISAGHYPEQTGAANMQFGLKEYPEARKIIDWIVRANDYQSQLEFILVEPGPLPDKVKFIESRLDKPEKPVGPGHPCPLAVEIHFNACGSAIKASGVETLCYPGSDDSYSAAVFIQNSLLDTLPFPNRGVKQRSDLYFLSALSIPAVIVETLFIDNNHEALYLNYPRGSFLIAKAIVQGIKNYFEGRM